MADDAFGSWRPLSLDEAREELAGCPAPWWFTGGIALELFADASWRSHDDLDVGIRRCDAATVLDHLRSRGWEVVVAAAGELTAWDGGSLREDLHQNNVWCRRPGGPWQLDVTVGDGDDDRWVYRRDRAISRTWPVAVREVAGLRFLAPELQLLFKSKDVRPKDTVDAEQVIPMLDGGGLALLVAQFRAGHPWLDLARRHAPGCGQADVLHVLDLLVDAGVHAWVDGGWAVDALLGEQTRPHADLDLAVARADLATAIHALVAHGFMTVRDDGPHVQVLADEEGRTVDVHAFDPTIVTVDADGTRRCAGDGLAYEADGFGGVGRIAGREVRCIAPGTLVRYHTGYEVDADDWHDVRLLCERFDLPVPPDYERFR